MQFVDTNIFIRFLTRDDAEKAKACFKLFELARQKKIKLRTIESIISEIAYILSSKRLYNLSPREISKRIIPILKIQGLNVPFKNTLLEAFEIYSKYKLDFEDAVLVAHMQRSNTKEIYSYDFGFDKIKRVRRLEPNK